MLKGGINLMPAPRTKKAASIIKENDSTEYIICAKNMAIERQIVGRMKTTKAKDQHGLNLTLNTEKRSTQS